MPIGKVYGVHPNEIDKISEARKKINVVVSNIMKMDITSVETFFVSDLDPDSFNGDVVLEIMSKSFSNMSEDMKIQITQETNGLLKSLFPSNKHVRRRLWETFLISAPSYGLH